MSVTTLKTKNHKVELQFIVHDETKFDDYIQRIATSAKVRQNHLTDEQRMEMLFGVDSRDKDLSQLPEGVTLH